MARLATSSIRRRRLRREGSAVDTTAPTITSSASHTTPENAVYSATATANETVTWSKGGTDAGLVTLDATTGAWSIGAQDYETKPIVSFTLTATDAAGNSSTQTITVTITDVAEGVITTWSATDKDVDVVLANGNLSVSTTVSGYNSVRGTIGRSTGKWVFAVDPTALGGASVGGIGLGTSAAALSNYVGATAASIGWFENGKLWRGGTNFSTVNTYTTAASELMIAVDLDARLIWFRNGSGLWNNSASANPATGSGGIAIGITGTLFPLVTVGPSDAFTANFGASAFANAVPAGFTAWNG